MARKVTVNVKGNEKEYMKKYFAENKELVKCECGSHIDIFSMRKHIKTKKHIQVMELLNNIKELEQKIII
jgi:hypothetical protein